MDASGRETETISEDKEKTTTQIEQYTTNKCFLRTRSPSLVKRNT